jgi:hypothetical protein
MLAGEAAVSAGEIVAVVDDPERGSGFDLCGEYGGGGDPTGGSKFNRCQYMVHC